MQLAAFAGAGALAAQGSGLHFASCIGSLRQRLPDFATVQTFRSKDFSESRKLGLPVKVH